MSFDVISNVETKTLTKGASYPVLKVIDKEDGLELFDKKYRIVGDDGITRNYLARLFKEIVRDEEMLNGKCEVKFSSNLAYVAGFRTGMILEFKDGVTNVNGVEYTGVKSVENFNERYQGKVRIELCKEYLTISELEFRCKGRRLYKDEENRVWEVVEGNLFSVDTEEDIVNSTDLDRLIKMKFTEHNPNQKRIDELENLINATNSEIQGTEQKHKYLVMVLDSYIAEMDELKG